jgi:hypothetical protein
MPRAPRIDPALVQTWVAAAERLRAAGRGERTAIVRELAGAHGLGSADAVYRRLRQYGGWESGRATRADAGRRSIDEDALHTVAGIYREGARRDGRRIMSLEQAASIAEQSGFALPVSTSQLHRYLRAARMDARSQARAEVYAELRSLHPNHVHQIDPSLCVLYWMGGKQHMLREEDFYKNKLDRYARVQEKVWRYVRYDHFSGLVDVHYYLGAGESQRLMFEFLCWTWGRQPGRLSHGVPGPYLMWDAGSANTAHGISSLLDALDVETLVHTPGRPNVKGGVENANLLVERGFESRLRFEPVADIEALNTAAGRWQEAWNANRLPRIDSRVHRPGGALVRADLWMLIRPEQLRELPPREVCARCLEGKPETRIVRQQAKISYAHPVLGRAVPYSLAGIADIHRGDTVEIAPLLIGADGEQGLIRLRWTDTRGEVRTYRVAPQLAFDAAGRPLTAAVIGQDYRAPKQRAAQRAGAALDAAAYPRDAAARAADREVDDVAHARKQRAKNATPFGGRINAISHLADIETPHYLPRQGEQIDLQAPEDASPPVPIVRALSRLVQARGRALAPEEAAWLRTRYGQHVPEADLVRLCAQPPGGTDTDLRGAGAPAEPAADGPRRMVRGGC